MSLSVCLNFKICLHFVFFWTLSCKVMNNLVLMVSNELFTYLSVHEIDVCFAGLASAGHSPFKFRSFAKLRWNSVHTEDNDWSHRGQYLNACKMIHLTCIYPTFCNIDDIVLWYFFLEGQLPKNMPRNFFFSINWYESRRLHYICLILA